MYFVVNLLLAAESLPNGSMEYCEERRRRMSQALGSSSNQQATISVINFCCVTLLQCEGKTVNDFSLNAIIALRKRHIFEVYAT